MVNLYRLVDLQVNAKDMSAGKCKRGPDVLLGATSSSSDDDSPRSADTSATTATSTEPASPSSAQTISHEYDVSSPGSSSTLSGGGGGPSDVRLPGFSQHSQQVSRRPRVKKKKADLNVASGDILCSLGPAGHSEQTARQLASSRLAKHQLTPRAKPPRGL